MAVYPTAFDTPHRGLEWLQYYSAHNVYHPGWDLNRGTGNQDLGDPVFCPVDGEVEYVSPEPTAWNRYNGGLGWFVVIYHPGEGRWTRYAHCDRINVNQNQKVKTGETIAEVGKSGTTYAHLHVEGWLEAGYKIQKDHWRRFAYYPSGKSKEWVVDHYFDVLAWVDEINAREPGDQQVSKWAKEAQKNLMELGITDGTRPHDKMTREEAWVMQDRVITYIKSLLYV